MIFSNNGVVAVGNVDLSVGPYQHLLINLTIIFLINQLIVWSVRHYM